MNRWLLFLFLSAHATAWAQSKDPGKDSQVIGMDHDTYVSGGVVATVFGFGTGHAIQGRYAEVGWVFTAGEIAAGSLVIASIAPCRDQFFSQGNVSLKQRLDKCQKVGLVIGDLSFLGFRLWETVDAWLTPNPGLKAHLFGRSEAPHLLLTYLPPLAKEPGALNLVYRF